jgi:hypothetical protein
MAVRMTNHEISAIDEMAVILVLLASDYFGTVDHGDLNRVSRWRSEFIEKTCRIAYGQGWDPEDLIHPEGVEALAMYMHCIDTDTWELPVAIFPKGTAALNCTGARQSWRWQRVVTKTKQHLARREAR